MLPSANDVALRAKEWYNSFEVISLKEEFVESTAPLILFKITKKDYINDIVNNGHFYFTLAHYFRSKACENPNSYIYDIDECSQTRKISMYIKHRSDDQYELLFDSRQGHIAINNNQCLFCTYSVQKNVNREVWNEGKGCYECVISSEIIGELCNNENIEDYGLLIFEFPYKTLEKINNKLADQKIIGARGHVVYDDHDFIPEFEQDYIKNSIEVCFHKRKRFKSQNEFRIVAINKENKNLESVYIGSLEEDEYTMHSLQKNKDLLIEIYPYLNQWINDDLLKVSVDHVEVKWI